MTIKTVTNADSGTADIVGGDDWDAVADIINNGYLTSTFKIYGSGGVFSYIFVGSNIAANRNITLPLMTGNDTIALLALAQTFTNKTLTSPVVNTPSMTDVAITTWLDQTVQTAPANPAAGSVRVYPKAVDANNDGWFIKKKLAGAIIEEQVG